MADIPLIEHLYRHKKGDLYQVIALGEDSETHEPVVIYRRLRDGKVFTRPEANFQEPGRFELAPDLGPSWIPGTDPYHCSGCDSYSTRGLSGPAADGCANCGMDARTITRVDNPGYRLMELHAQNKALQARVDSMGLELEETRANLAQAMKLWDGPETEDFLEAVRKEAAFQVAKWGVSHDRAKQPEDFVFLVGYLGGKASQSQKDGDLEKAKHHTISSAAVLFNWHQRLCAGHGQFQPGSDDAAKSEEA